ncbi:MAG: hypothetical protein ACW97X_03180 [Candidatus Hodarchaeales archaeon]
MVSYSKSNIVDIPIQETDDYRAPILIDSKCVKCGYCVEMYSVI